MRRHGVLTWHSVIGRRCTQASDALPIISSVITSPTGRAYACGKWGAPTDDARALQPPGVSHAHTIAGVSSKGWASFHVDVLAAPTSSGRKYNLTLYMVDFDREHIRLGVKAMRMEGAHTINSSNTTSTAEGRQLGHAATIAPMVLVQDFDAGAC